MFKILIQVLFSFYSFWIICFVVKIISEYWSIFHNETVGRCNRLLKDKNRHVNWAVVQVLALSLSLSLSFPTSSLSLTLSLMCCVTRMFYAHKVRLLSSSFNGIIDLFWRLIPLLDQWIDWNVMLICAYILKLRMELPFSELNKFGTIPLRKCMCFNVVLLQISTGH